ncbi:hypothetical protein [Paenibacillus periandrae]|uniref:hypothetical protein n=1 Tax=Paenibacillus periandrae TaxID=1761741 RepID=UPI001F091563|nr:hypothetical protein [Paenibacillus periandrae]
MRVNHIRIKTNCSAHTEINAVTTCIQCGDGLCMNCHNDNNPGFCYRCSGRPAVMKRVEEPSAQVTREKRIKRVVIIVSLTIIGLICAYIGAIGLFLWLVHKGMNSG